MKLLVIQRIEGTLRSRGVLLHNQGHRLGLAVGSSTRMALQEIVALLQHHDAK